MENTAKTAIILAIFLLILGAILFVCSLWANGWSFGSANFESAELEISDTFQGISLKTDTADITFVPSQDGKVKIELYEHKKVKHNATVTDGVLNIGYEDKRAWSEKMFNFSSPRITIYLPDGDYGALTIDASTGDISLQVGAKFESIKIDLSTGDIFLGGISASSIDATVSTGKINMDGIECSGAIKLKSSTGNVNLSNIKCASFESVGTTSDLCIENAVVSENVKIERNTGDTVLKNVQCASFEATGSTGALKLVSVIVSGTFKSERDTGDITFENSDAAEFYIKSSTGSVKGILLSEKIFYVYSSSGKVQVPECTSGGIFKCETSAGNVKIEIAQ